MTVARKLQSLNGICEVIEKIARYLRVVGLNIGIESSRSAESSEKFGVVVEEIRSFVEKVRGSCGRNSYGFRRLHKLCRSLHTSKYQKVLIICPIWHAMQKHLFVRASGESKN